MEGCATLHCSHRIRPDAPRSCGSEKATLLPPAARRRRMRGELTGTHGGPRPLSGVVNGAASSVAGHQPEGGCAWRMVRVLPSPAAVSSRWFGDESHRAQPAAFQACSFPCRSAFCPLVSRPLSTMRGPKPQGACCLAQSCVFPASSPRWMAGSSSKIHVRVDQYAFDWRCAASFQHWRIPPSSPGLFLLLPLSIK